MSVYPYLDYEELYNTSPCGYVCSSPNGEIIESNRRFLEFTGYTQNEIIGKKKLSDFLTPGGKIYSETHFWPILRMNDSIDQVNFDFVNKDGSRFPVLINSIVIKNDEGNPKYIQFTIFNISDRKSYEKELLISKRNAEDLSSQLRAKNKELSDGSKLILEQKLELERLNEELKNKNRQLSDFAYIASHNLRAPAINLRSMVDLYTKSTDAEEKQTFFGFIHKLAYQINDTLNELINSLKVREDFDTAKGLITFADILDKTMNMVSAQIMETKAIITSDFSDADKISYSKIYLESALLNLLSNALKYRSPDRIPSIHFQTKNEPDNIVLTVKDNGLGIDMKKDGNRLFGLNNTFHNHPHSKGVGLYMTKVQIEAMGGKISAESEVGIGSTFKIIFRKNL